LKWDLACRYTSSVSKLLGYVYSLMNMSYSCSHIPVVFVNFWDMYIPWYGYAFVSMCDAFCKHVWIWICFCEVYTDAFVSTRFSMWMHCVIYTDAFVSTHFHTISCMCEVYWLVFNVNALCHIYWCFCKHSFSISIELTSKWLARRHAAPVCDKKKVRY
jgi:hypothetical protein